MNKKKLNQLLAGVVFIIWAVIIAQVVNTLIKNRSDSNNSDIIKDEQSLLPASVTKDTLVSNEIVLDRDPFELNPVIVHYTAPAKEPAKADTKPAGIMFRVGGVVINNERKVVLLDDLTNKKTMFLREQEHYLNLQIISIKQESVVISDNGLKAEYKIDRSGMK